MVTTPAPVVYDTAIEGLYLRGLKRHLTPALRARLRELGVELSAKLKASYPREVWVRGLRACVAELFPTVTDEEGFRRLGELNIDGMAETLVGKAMLATAKLLGPRRTLHRMSQAFGSHNNFMKATVTDLSPTSLRIDVNDTYDAPTYSEGAMRGILKVMGVRGEVKIVPPVAPGAVIAFEISWTP